MPLQVDSYGIIDKHSKTDQSFLNGQCVLTIATLRRDDHSVDIRRYCVVVILILHPSIVYPFDLNKHET